jgi:hypothetical protein
MNGWMMYVVRGWSLHVGSVRYCTGLYTRVYLDSRQVSTLRPSIQTVGRSLRPVLAAVLVLRQLSGDIEQDGYQLIQ